MINARKYSVLFFTLSLLCSGCTDSRQSNNPVISSTQKSTILNLHVILGSTREGRTSDKIGKEILTMIQKMPNVNARLIDLRDFNLPFFNESTPPASREVITDPLIKKWSDVISAADAFIIVSPEYNAGYPGVLKNALDSLYKEWNHKPVAFVGYSGGSSGGSNAIAQLIQVAKGLEMNPVESTIKIPKAWKAFDSRGHLADETIAQELEVMVKQLASAVKK